MNQSVTTKWLIVWSLLAGWFACVAAEEHDLVVTKYAPAQGTIAGCTQIFFRDRLEIVTTGRRLYFRDRPDAEFRESPVALFDDAHSVVYNPRDRLFYATDTGRHRLLAFRELGQEQIERSATMLAGAKLDRPHDVVIDGDGWLYALNPNGPLVFRFRGFGKEESSLDLSQHLGYSRALTVAEGKLYVVGSSVGKVVEIDDFARKQFRVHTSFGKRRDAPAGTWQTTGLVPNDVEFFQGYWYVTSYFCPTYAQGTDCNEKKFLRFRSWKDFETGNWQDLSNLLPRDVVPYYLTVRENGLFLATFSHEVQGDLGQVFRVASRR